MSKKLSFEEAVKRLEEIVSSLEKGELTLETALKYHKEGVELSKICQGYLEKAEKELEVL